MAQRKFKWLSKSGVVGLLLLLVVGGVLASVFLDEERFNSVLGREKVYEAQVHLNLLRCGSRGGAPETDITASEDFNTVVEFMKSGIIIEKVLKRLRGEIGRASCRERV